MFGCVVRVPEFGGDPKIVSCYRTFGDGFGDTLARFDFVAIITSRVQVPITAVDCCFNHITDNRAVNFPKPKPNGRDL